MTEGASAFRTTPQAVAQARRRRSFLSVVPASRPLNYLPSPRLRRITVPAGHCI